MLLMQYSPGAHLANSRLTIAETGKIKATARQREKEGEEAGKERELTKNRAEQLKRGE